MKRLYATAAVAVVLLLAGCNNENPSYSAGIRFIQDRGYSIQKSGRDPVDVCIRYATSQDATTAGIDDPKAYIAGCRDARVPTQPRLGGGAP